MSESAGVTLSAGTLPELSVAVPSYDRSGLTQGLVHIGVGGFHRAHQALFHDRLLAEGASEWAICGLGALPGDRRMQEALDAQDGLYTLVERAPGEEEARVIGSITGYVLAPDDPEAAIEKLAAETTRIVSLTVTEGGYNISDVTGEFDPDNEDVAHDLEEGATPRTTFGLVTEALARRRERGFGPFTVMSCDNLQGNGERAHYAFTTFARLRDPELGEWIEEHVTFPNSMVDRITPATTDADRDAVRERFGIDDRWPVVCEPFIQWVLEDAFCAGRPPYEDVGVQVVDDVEPYELMKLRLLNASHQALAYFGHLLGHEYVHEAAQDEPLRALVRKYMDEEATPTLPPVPGVDLEDYKATLIERFSNPGVRDTVARLCRRELRSNPEVARPGHPPPARDGRRGAARRRRGGELGALRRGHRRAGRADRGGRPPARRGDGARPPRAPGPRRLHREPRPVRRPRRERALRERLSRDAGVAVPVRRARDARRAGLKRRS